MIFKAIIFRQSKDFQISLLLSPKYQNILKKSNSYMLSQLIIFAKTKLCSLSQPSNSSQTKSITLKPQILLFSLRSYIYIFFLEGRMNNLLQRINMFPYNQFIRIGGKQKLDHTFGGVISLFIILFLGGILTIKLVEAFSKRTLIFESLNSINVEGVPTLINTFKSDQKHQQFMMAFDVRQPLACSDTKMNINSYIYTAEGGYADPNRKEIFQTFELEKCTSNHFASLPQVTEKESTGYNQWLCLPQNKTFEISGSYDLSLLYKALYFEFNCQKSCPSGSCGRVNIYHLSSVANPSNSSHPFSYRLDRNTIMVNKNWFYYHELDLDQTVIQTDNSLLPLKELNKMQGIKGDLLSIEGYVQTPVGSGTQIIVQRSSSTININRSYLKLVDVLSYVGGIFPTIFAIFFFINYFGAFSFEIGFAGSYFKKIEAKHYGVLCYLRYLIYKALSFINCEPKNWAIVRKQEQIKERVNRFIDFQYLFRRIDFLEKAISVLLQKHQLKGLHLLHSLTLEEAESSCKAHQLRERLVYFMHSLKLRVFDQPQRQPGKDHAKRERSKSPRKKLKKTRTFGQGFTNSMKSSGKSEMTLKNTKVSGLMDKIFEEVNLGFGAVRKRERQACLQMEVVKIGELQDEEVREAELINDLKTDLSLLFEEGNKGSDQRSRRIYESIDGWLKEELQSLMSNLPTQQEETVLIDIDDDE